jgi:hypothetical protein
VKLAGEYAREALKLGTAIENKLRTNPDKFGMIGGTDNLHISGDRRGDL